MGNDKPDMIIIDDPNVSSTETTTQASVPSDSPGVTSSTTETRPGFNEPEMPPPFFGLFGGGRRAQRSIRKAPSWWAERQADAIERRAGRAERTANLTRTTPEKMQSAGPLPRPEGMSRQTHRRLYREACKIAGVDPVKKRGE